MSDDLPVIEIRDAHMSYRVHTDAPTGARASRRRPGHGLAIVAAVRGVTLDITEGEVVGIVGRNGSGKSSLMRAIAGLQTLDRGSIRVRGEPSLLGVGAVLNRDLSGGRNIVLGCLALGMSLQEARQRLPSVVEFSGLGDAVDRPLRTYSSGMRSRLQFAIATSVRPDILLIDEALSVGDQEFRKRSRRRIRRMRKRATTVIVVSHNLGLVRRLCNRVMWMADGQVIMDGKPRAVIREYRRS